MRDRRKPSNKNRSNRQSEAAGERRMARGASGKPAETRISNHTAARSGAATSLTRRKEKPPREEKKGGFFSLLGGSNRRRQRRDRESVGSAANVAVNRLVDLQQRREGISQSASILPLRKKSDGNRQRRNALRNSTGERPKNLISLPNPRTKSGKFMLYGMRLMIFGIGVGVLAGTLMSVWDPASNLNAGASAGKTEVAVETRPADDFKMGQEMTQLKAQLLSISTQNKQMKTGVLLLDLDTNAYVDINASDSFPAASTIKFPILVAFFQDVDAGKIQLAEPLTMKKEQVATESGDMQYQAVGTQFSAIETATNMMVVSDNTATNMLIERLGGMPALNQRFKSWGLSATMTNNLLPDVQGQNTTSPKDLAKLMSQVQSGKVVSMKSRDRILDIMRRVENDSLLPKGLGNGATISHKTGTLGVLLGDVGLIDTPNGKRYLASVLVQRPRDDARAEEMIQQISKLTYQSFTQPQSAQSFDRPRIAQP